MVAQYKTISRRDNSLRPYQAEAKESIFQAWDECDNVLFQMPTGTGKTRLFTSIISDIKAWSVLNSVDCRILIVAHRIELIDQISENLDRYRVPHGIIAGGRERDLRQYVQVASIQTITHRSNIEAIGELSIKFIIIDEAHHSVANSYKKLWRLFSSAKKLGVTATPWRMNNSGFLDCYDRIIISKPIKSFIAEGWLSAYNFYSVQDQSLEYRRINSITEFDSEGDYKVSALEREMDTLQIRARLFDSYSKYAAGKKGIIYSISRKHSEHICEEYKRSGVRIVSIDAKTPRDERRLYVQRFRKGLIDIIVNVDIFSEGFDCPDIEFIQLARPTRSLIKYLQQVGRGLRPTEGKTKCIILDNVGVSLQFGLPDAERPWNEYFIGCPTRERESSFSSGTNTSHSVIERDLSEGTDELVLLQGVEGGESAQGTNKWSAEDIELLKTLVLSKDCDSSVLAMVFKTTEDDINAQLIAAGVERQN